MTKARSLLIAGAAFIAGSVAGASHAMAAQATMGDVSIALPAPAGFCDMSDSNPSDNRMITIVTDLVGKSGNKLLGMSADCRQLDDWRAGKRQLLDDFAQYQAVAAIINSPPSETIPQSCATLRAEGNKIVSNQMPDVKERVEEALKNVKMDETRFIGVLSEDPNACYGGLIQQLHSEAGTDKTQLNLFAVTIIKNRNIFAYRFSVYNGPDSVTDALAKLKDDVASLYATNK
jgi:hypothetical protein